MRRAVLLLVVGAGAGFAQPVEDLRKSLDDVARIAGVMVDGDVCQRIMTARSREYLVKVDPRDQWIDADNFDVNAAPYIQTKKTLIRLAHLVNFPCDVNLWMPVAEKPGRVQVLEVRPLQALQVRAQLAGPPVASGGALREPWQWRPDQLVAQRARAPEQS